MCGIIGAIASRDVRDILLEGLARLEYRGYDSAGLAMVDSAGSLTVFRTVGKVAELASKLEGSGLSGPAGIAHSRWATHGGVTVANAHPHVSPAIENGRIAIVHNGIIENYAEIKERLVAEGYIFTSETDTEVVAHLVHHCLEASGDLLAAVREATKQLVGAYSIVVIDAQQPNRLVAARLASPLVIGRSEEGNYVASDAQALLPITNRFQYMEEGDVAEIRRDFVRIFDLSGSPATRPEKTSKLSPNAIDRGPYRHFMLKEIFEQPYVLADTLAERVAGDHVLEDAFGPEATKLLPRVKAVHIVACGTSYHAGLVARYYLEQGARIPCTVEIASEYRYRNPVVPPDTLFLAISQSGETADTLAALREARKLGKYLAVAAICNVPESSLVREADLVLMTRAGPEIGVASTKAFTTQLIALALTGLAIAQASGFDRRTVALYTRQLRRVPEIVERTLLLDSQVRAWATAFADKHHALFLGRGPTYPIALEGALKLKEISYIHAEAYPAGELKHGPLALIDADMPVIAVAPNDFLIEKLRSNIQEVQARGGQLFVLADPRTGFSSAAGMEVMTMPEHIEPLQAPLAYTVPLQLLAYHVAVLRGTDVDQPRNLAKSVTVE